MSVHYLIMVPRYARCEACDGSGTRAEEVDDGDDFVEGECRPCGGRGHTDDVSWEPRPATLYDNPGTARGVVKRAQRPLRFAGEAKSWAEEGRTFKLLRVDTDKCDPMVDRMPLDQQYEIAAERALFWGGRALALQPKASRGVRWPDAGEAVTVATDAIIAGRLDDARTILASAKPEEVRLEPQELDVVRRALANLVGSGEVVHGITERFVHQSPDRSTFERAKTVLARLDAAAALHELHERASHGAARTVAELELWATGRGSRRCLLDVSRSAGPGYAWSACGSRVPEKATTADPAQVACVGCSRAVSAALDSPSVLHLADTSRSGQGGSAHTWCGDVVHAARATTIRHAVRCPRCRAAAGIA